MSIAQWLLVVMVIETVAILCAAWLAFGGFFRGMRLLAKIGIFLMTMGLMVQVTRTLFFVEHGYAPVDSFFPMWATKDIGSSILIFDLLWLSIQSRSKDSHSPPPPTT